MGMTDPIADLLSRIRNAQSAKHDIVSIPASNIKKAILGILKHEGFIQDYSFDSDDKQGVLNIILKYDQEDSGIILGLSYIRLEFGAQLVDFFRVILLHGLEASVQHCVVSLWTFRNLRNFVRRVLERLIKSFGCLFCIRDLFG